MRKNLFLFLFFSTFCFGQDLKFETPFYDAVDHWVAFNKTETDSAYILGFLYIDEQAGFTFDYHTRFKQTDKGLEKLPTSLNRSLKARLHQNTADVYVLTQKQLAELELPAEPDWLKFYKPNEDKNEYLVNIGFHFNHVGASKNAIAPLLKAYAKDPHFRQLEFELSYAYNATGAYKEAIEILDKALQNDPKNFWYFKELGFAHKKLGDIETAEKIYTKGIALSNNDEQKAEMAYNMAQSYFETKNKPKFEEWNRLTRKYAKKNSIFTEYLDYFEANWEQPQS